jgi:hypothetical protein
MKPINIFFAQNVDVLAETGAKFLWSLQQMIYLVPLHLNTTSSSTEHKGAQYLNIRRKI